jgi:hypothetical protein
MMEMNTLFRETLHQPQPIVALREAVISVRAEGVSKEEILHELENLRAEVGDVEEGAILDTMDFLVGWCSPHMKLE